MNLRSSHEPPHEAAVGVLVVDDQAAFRRVARAVIDATPGFNPVGEAASGDEALAFAEQLHPDLVLMDVQMPGMNGFEVARQLRRSHPESVVVLISLDDIEGFEPAVASCGASAFVLKQDLAPRTLRRLWTTHGGGP
ncbi:MAG: response regulator transcription factor [Solirubrobacterales bacterium]|nr:response regulator transcription factor [Solirubrobacterales bacterium]MBV8942814.1 response regulator transcription factor [Solirubrobacterales bacterium]MBV9168281.1 response regulator transcription factor [Solirubrobacterales bacterium]